MTTNGVFPLDAAAADDTYKNIEHSGIFIPFMFVIKSMVQQINQIKIVVLSVFQDKELEWGHCKAGAYTFLLFLLYNEENTNHTKVTAITRFFLWNSQAKKATKVAI